MKRIKNTALKTFLCVLCASVVNLLPTRAADAPAPLYTQDFEKTAEGEAPSDMVILSGTFAVKVVDGNHVLELPGDPLDGFGVLLGPEGEQYLSVQARVQATSTGKRFPEFGVGLGDTNGYKLIAMPAAGQVQIYKGEDVVATAPLAWKSGAWTTVKLQARKNAEGKAVVEGKAWASGEAEPKDWQVTFTDTEDAPKGRASIWGTPYASTPIRFDDVVVTKAGG